jgi:hypothetical protein
MRTWRAATSPTCLRARNAARPTVWGFHVDLRGSASGSGNVAGTASGTAQVAPVGTAEEHEVSHSVDVVITPETAVVRAKAFDPTISVEDLPTEVIAEALRVGINILRPIDGQWPIGVTGYNIIGYAGIGNLGEGLLGSMAWIEELALRWEKKLQQGD